jgi:hypothetical protein
VGRCLRLHFTMVGFKQEITTNRLYYRQSRGKREYLKSNSYEDSPFFVYFWYIEFSFKSGKVFVLLLLTDLDCILVKEVQASQTR